MTAVEIYSESPVHHKFNKSVLMEHCMLSQELDEYLFTGSLVYYEHLSLDPFIAASFILQNTKHHIPLIALQPYTLQPFTAAKIVHSLASLYQRKVYLNIVSGQVSSEFDEIGDQLGKNERYLRLIEFTQILRLLLSTNEPLTFNGQYYQYKNLRINSALPLELMPKIFIASGSSSAESLDAASKVGDVLVSMSTSMHQYRQQFSEVIAEKKLELGIKVNIIAGQTREEALSKAKKTHQFRVRAVTKSVIKDRLQLSDEENDIFYPTNGDKGNAPMWIGSYDQIARYVSQYRDLGVKHFIIQNANNAAIGKDVYEIFREE
ncbi:LLM class flavin-dependent oxidoreductase [Paenibacillus oryzisoli]|uniref:LLM class flavin-dependent oxidoreductase n=1 Tax=Paenibacillus oryzisoli TaxID=1850517 RepID=UPI003D281041